MVVRVRRISPSIIGLALVLALCGLPSRSVGYGWPWKPNPARQSRYEHLTPSAMSALAGRSFEYWADRELHGPGQCDTPESDFRGITPRLKGAVTFSLDGRAIDLTLADKAPGPVPLPGLRDRRDGSAVYSSSTLLVSFRVSIGGSPVSAELSFHGFGLCVTSRTRGTLRLAPAPNRSDVPER